MALTTRRQRSPVQRNAACTEDCLLHSYEEGSTADAVLNLSVAFGPPCSSLDQAVLAEQLYRPIYDWEIRILALEPGKLGEPLEATIHLAVITHDKSIVLHESRFKTNYEALSYCWGEPIFDHSISCNGLGYPITRSVYQALQRLRFEEEVRYLWVDQLCINQQDFPERSVQVQKMLLIYQSACKVIVWLDEAGVHTGAAIRTTVDICERVKTDMAVGSRTLADMVKPLDGRLETDFGWILPETFQAIQFCTHHWQMFVLGAEDLLSRPWYGRLWVLQEIWAAKAVAMYCGSHSVSMDDLERLTKGLCRYFKPHCNPFQRLRRGRDRKDRDDLLEAMQRASASHCSDVRDRVYGVLAIASHDGHDHDGRSPHIAVNVDYTRHPSQIWQDVVKAHVTAHRHLGLWVLLKGAHLSLDHTTIFGGEVDGCRIPSWCPNFSKPWSWGRHPEFQNYLSNYFRTGEEPGNDQTRFEPFDLETLLVKGIRLARVGDTTSVQDRDRECPCITFNLDPGMTPWGKLKLGMKVEIDVDGTTVTKPTDCIVAVARSWGIWILRESRNTGHFTFVGAATIMNDRGYWVPYEKCCEELLEKNAHCLEEFHIE